MKTRQHPGKLVAQLRQIIGKSQPQFAAMIGYSKHAIISVENGRNHLSPKLVKQILFATGAEITSQQIRFCPMLPDDFSESFGKLTPEAAAYWHNRRNRFDAAYTREDFDQWRANFFPSNDETARKCCDAINIWLAYILRAAAKPGKAGNRDRLPAVFKTLLDCLDQTRKTFKLESEIDALLESETHRRGAQGFEIASLLTSPANQKQLSDRGFNFDKLKSQLKNRHPDEWLIIETEVRRIWDWPYLVPVPLKSRKIVTKPRFWIEPISSTADLMKAYREKVGLEC
jgi:transcriptional regulator with XRE-family HTH domain